jgi:hypothetical protein
MALSNRRSFLYIVFLPVIITGLTTFSANAQARLRNFGDVTKQELEMKSYRLDTTADAVVLFNRGTLEVDPKEGSRLTRSIRIKIFRKSAYGRWGNFVVMAPSTASISELTGVTYNLEDGEIEKTVISSDRIFKTMFGGHVVKAVLALPNLKEGTIFECRYSTKETSVYFNDYDWPFQYDIPVVWSEYTVRSRIPYSIYLRGSLAMNDSSFDKKALTGYFQMANIPAFNPELEMPDPNAYHSLLLLRLGTETWNSVCGSLSEFGNVEQNIKNQLITNLVDSLIDGVPDSLEKIKRISGFIKRKVAWNKVFRRDYYNLKNVLKQKTGSSGDINGLLASMLQAAGFHPKSVFLSTREHGFIQDNFPATAQFNYLACILEVGGHSLLLDATEKLLPYDLPPPRCYNHRGLLIEAGKCRWIPIEPLQSKKTTVEARLALDSRGTLTGTSSVIRSGYAAFEARQNYKRIGDEGYKKLSQLSSGFQLKELLNLDDIDKPIIERFEGNLADATVVKDLIYVDPNFFTERDFFDFREPERTYPIDFGYLLDKTVLCTIAIPEGYEIDEVPQNKLLTMRDKSASYALNVARLGNSVNITWRMKINRTIFQPDEYLGLREFYSNVISKKSENIVFRKKP